LYVNSHWGEVVTVHASVCIAIEWYSALAHELPETNNGRNEADQGDGHKDEEAKDGSIIRGRGRVLGRVTTTPGKSCVAETASFFKVGVVPTDTVSTADGMTTPEATLEWTRVFRFDTDLVDTVLGFIQDGVVKLLNPNFAAFEIQNKLATRTTAAMLSMAVCELDTRGRISLI